MGQEQDYRALLLEIYAAGLAAVNGEQAVYQALADKRLRRPTHVIAIGKAAEAMFMGAWRYYAGHIAGGLLITKHDHVSAETRQLLTHVQIIEAAHPVPDQTSLQAGLALLDYLHTLPEKAEALFLISGGASSLVEVLAPDWTLDKLQQTTQQLLANGSSIDQINAMRRSTSLIKGGKLWNYLQDRRVRCLLISDVPSNDPAIIGSGLLFPVPEQAAFEWQLVATNQHMLERMQQAALTAGLTVTVHEELLQGNAEQVAGHCIGHLCANPAGLYLWGAETTVQLPEQPGRGGRNQHLALAAALHIQVHEPLWLLVAGTDGTDGNTVDTGALIDVGTLQRGRDENLDPHTCLQKADAGTFLAASGDLIYTGPTGTNVMDVIVGFKP